MPLPQGFLTTARYSSRPILISSPRKIPTVVWDRHEIAFVFGQLLSPHAVPALLQVLQNTQESDMVRHEAAEALGGIATPEVLPYLKEYMTRGDVPAVVRESCQVALDMYEVGILSFSGAPPVFDRSISPCTDDSTKIQISFSTPMD